MTTKIQDGKEELEKAATAADLVAQDVNERWPVWVKMAKSLEDSQFSSPHMLVASQLLSLGIMGMLVASVSEAAVLASAESILHQHTHPEVNKKLVALHDKDDNKKEMLELIEGLIRDNASRLEEIGILRKAN